MKLAIVILLGLTACLSKPGAPGGGSGDDDDCGTDCGGSGSAMQLAVGGEHACAILSDGTLACWGQNNKGQAGSSNDDSLPTPAPPSARTGWTSIAAGYMHTCGIASGDVYCWGSDEDAESSAMTGNFSVGETPIPLPAGAGMPARIYAGYDGSCAIDDGGKLYCWGAIAAKTYKSVTQLSPGGLDGWQDVAIAQDHVCATQASTRAVYCWGDNDVDQLGIANGKAAVDVDHASPKLGSDSQPDALISVTVYGTSSCAVRVATNELVCWGSDADARFSGSATIDKVVPNAPALAWVDVALGEKAACATDGNGEIYCWGDDGNGARGDGLDGRAGTNDTPAFTAAPILKTGAHDRTLALGDAMSCAIDINNRAYCWGANDLGQLGLGEVASQLLPAQVAMPGMTASMIAVGGQQTCAAVDPTGASPPSPTANQVMCWGNNTHQEITGDATQLYLTPTSTTALGSASVDQLSAGLDHTCAHRTAGSATCWGDGDYQALFLGGGAHITTKPYTVVRASGPATCAGSGGNLDCYGTLPPDGNERSTTFANTTWQAFGVHGQLVVGTPAIGGGEIDEIGVDQIGTVHGVSTPYATLAAGATAAEFQVADDHACAGYAGGPGGSVLFCWGSNNYAQLGSAATADAGSNMVANPTGDTWVGTIGTFSAAGGHTCAITAGHALWCWGYNDDGSLSTNTDNLPAVIGAPGGAAAGWLYVSTNEHDTCAIATDYSVWCWGYNEYGEAGNGRSFSGTPQPVKL